MQNDVKVAISKVSPCVKPKIQAKRGINIVKIALKITAKLICNNSLRTL